MTQSVRTLLLLTPLIAAGQVRAEPISFFYQGELVQNGGPANGTFDLRFGLYSNDTDAFAWATFCADDVLVTNGRFGVPVEFNIPNSVLLPFPRSLQVEVRADGGQDCSAGTGYTTLLPRQTIAVAPIANKALGLMSPDGAPTNVLTVSNEGYIGIGTTTPNVTLDVRSQLPVVSISTGAQTAYQDVGILNLGYARLGDISAASTNFTVENYSGDIVLKAGSVNNAFTLNAAGDVHFGTNSAEYHYFRMGGGNSYGFLFSSYPALGDGIHLGYNYYEDSLGNPHFVNTGGATSRISTGYGSVSIATSSAAAVRPTERLFIGPTGRVGIGTSTPSSSYLVDVSGSLRCFGFTNSSSASFKKNVTPLAQGLQDLLKLQPVSYEWNDAAPAQVRGQHAMGLIAESVADVLPDAVTRDESGKPEGIEYSRITVVAIQAIKQQQAQHAAEHAELLALRERIDRLERMLAAEHVQQSHRRARQ